MTVVPLADGRWVSEKFAHLAEIVQDYDPYLEMQWIPPELRETERDRKYPYAIVDTRTHYVVKYVSELDQPEMVLAELFDIDNIHGDVLKRMDARNAAVEAFKLKKKMDELEEAKDFAAFVVGTKKNYIKHNGQKFDGDSFRRLS